MTILVSDSFNRANSTTTLGTTDSYAGGTAKTWNTLLQGASKVFGITSNKAYAASGTNPLVAYVDAGQADVSITVDLPNVNDYFAIVFRVDPTTGVFLLAHSDGTLQQHTSDGGWITLGSGASFASGNTAKVVANGSSITIYKNGVQTLTATSTINQTSTLHGFGNWRGTTGATWDNFIIEDLVVGGGGTDTTVTGIVATSTADTIVPTVTAQKQVSLTSVIADTTADTLIPTVSTVSSVSTSVNIIAAALTVDALNPTLSISSQIASIVSTATADTLIPTVSLSSSVSVLSVLADVTANAISPSNSVSSNINVISIVADSTADTLLPQVGSFTNISIDAVIVSATADTISPSVDAVRNISIQAVITDTTADVFSPFIGSSASAQITAVMSSITVDGIVPIISTSISSRIDSLIVSVIADGMSPTIQTDAIVSAIITELQVEGLAPTLRQNYIEYQQVFKYLLTINQKSNFIVKINDLPMSYQLVIVQKLYSDMEVAGSKKSFDLKI